MAETATTRKGAVEHPAAPFRRGKATLAQRRGRAGLWFVLPWIVGFFLWYAIPMVASLWFSFTDFNLVSDQPIEFTGLENWRELLSDPKVGNSALVTLKYGALALPFAILFPMALAYLLVSKRLRARETFRALFFMPSIIPFVAAVLIFGGLLNARIGWVNRALGVFGIEGPNWLLDQTWVYPSLVFIGIWGVGNAMIIFIASMNSVPSTLYDAARIDGAGEWRMFRHVTLPIISPIIFYNLVIALIGLFNYFLVPFVLNNGSGAPAGATDFYALRFFQQGFEFFNMGYAATLAWALFVVAVAITGLLFWSAKYWVYYEFRKG
ncbi:MAG: carbohydrate ABC transporter permease [Acidimicrobiia bacterium]